MLRGLGFSWHEFDLSSVFKDLIFDSLRFLNV